MGDLTSKQRLWIIVLGVIKIFLALLTFKYPLLGISLSLLWDWIDGGIFILVNMKLNVEKYFKIYHTYDKITDFVFDFSLLIFTILNFDLTIVTIASLLLLFRLIGLLSFYNREDSRYLLFFPNIFENFVIGWVLNTQLSLGLEILSVIAIATLLKIPQEIFLHGKGNRNVADLTVKLYEKVFKI